MVWDFTTKSGGIWQRRGGYGRIPGADLGGLASPYGLIPAGGVVLARGNAPGAAVDTGLNPTASTLRPERAAAGGILHIRRGRHLPSSPAAIIAQRVGAILPSSHP